MHRTLSSFVIITALLSAANSGLFAASRMMWSLSAKKQLPAVFSKINQRGIPYIAVIVTMVGALPGLLSEQFSPELIFKNPLGVAAFTMVIVWMSICLSHYNFRRQWYKQGHNSKLNWALRLASDCADIRIYFSASSHVSACCLIRKCWQALSVV